MSICKLESISSEGNRLFDGSGVKIGIISNSFDALGKAAEDVAAGELPGGGNPNGRNLPIKILSDLSSSSINASDEGRALAQIIHDISPGAELLFHTALRNDDENAAFIDGSSFEEAVSSLLSEGVDIIVDDIAVLDPLVIDGAAAKVVNKAVNDGTVFLSAVGNNGSISYNSEFRKGETFSLGGIDFETHDFDPSAGIDSFQDIEVPKGDVVLSPLFSSYTGGNLSTSNNTSDLFTLLLVDSPELPSLSNIKAISTILPGDSPNASLSAFGYLASENEELYYIVVREVNESAINGTEEIRWVSTANGSDRYVKYEYIDPLSGNATVYGQANAESVIAVGSASDDGTEYDSFASRGGTPIVFDGEGNFLPDPIIRPKPDVIGPDNVATAFPEDSAFNPFIGTSAAVANVAGVVALMEQAAGGPDVLTPEMIKFILGATDKPVEPAPGLPSSAGLVQPDLAVAGAAVAGQIASIFPNLFA